MYIDDYGLWFKAHEINKNKKGQVLVGGAWKNPVFDPKSNTMRPSTLVIQTDNMDTLEEACTQNDWGYLTISNNNEGITFLVEHVKDINLAKILLLLSSSRMPKGLPKRAAALEKLILATFGYPTISGLPEDEEDQMRRLYYDRFGIKLP